MQVNRMFEILYILLNRRTITAGELACHFEVSRRTIYRDIDALCQAGVPLYTSKGKNGGIGLMENFVLNRTLLTQEEQEEILAALRGLKAMHSTETDTALSKLSAFFGSAAKDWLQVDFSDWSRQGQTLFEDIRKAILQRKPLTFDYYNTCGEKSRRTVEPRKLWFKGRSWYLLAYCRERQAERMFKLSRLKNHSLQEEAFSPRPEVFIPDMQPSFTEIHLELWVHFSQAYRIYDEFDEDQITCLEDGSFRVWADYPLGEWVYGFILSFGEYARVIAPPFIKKEIGNRLKRALKIYTE